MRETSGDVASFEMLEGARSRVQGALEFSTVATLLPLGSAAIAAGRATVIDLGGVTKSDSSGLALLIEWQSVAKQDGQALEYANVPSQMHQLADLSDVEPLLFGAAAVAASAARGQPSA